MHNNGTNRLILPQKGPILASLANLPTQTIELEVGAGMVIAHIDVNGAKVDLTLNVPTCMQLGVNLISSGALCAAGIVPVPAPAPPADPDSTTNAQV